MATQVYLGGKGVIIAKNGGDTLNIPLFRAYYVLIGTLPVETIEDYTKVKFQDTLTQQVIEDKSLSVRDGSNNSVGSTVYEVKQYLESILLTGSTGVVSDEVCTKANQETMIAQNTEIDSKLNELNIIQEDSQEIIKKELQENNKLLRKIYN